MIFFQITTWLLFFGLFYLIFTSLIFIRNRFELTPLVTSPQSREHPKISVLIPARNEENSLGKLLDSLEHQSWEDYTVHVLDDQSIDRTFEIADSYRKKSNDRFYLHSGIEKPDDWLGKPWACFQLANKSDGEILVFLDADTVVESTMLEYTVNSMEYYSLDMLTVWPLQKMISFWEQTLIPVIYFTLLTLLPSIYVYRFPRWIPKKLRKKLAPKFAAACGQCLAFRRDAYDQIGGHKSVKSQVVEDVELAKEIKKKGFTLRMFNGVGSISCRMYKNGTEIFQGFRKNFLLGFNNNIPLFLASGFLHLVVYTLPFLTFILSFFIFDSTIFFLSIACITIILIERLILAIWYQMNPLFSFTHPLAVLWFQVLAAVKIGDHLSGRSTRWKGRKV